MPPIAPRIAEMNAGGSDGWEVFYRARAMAASGLPVTELTIGEHDIRTDPAILHAMHASAMGGHTGYAAVPGTPELRAAIAERVQARTGIATGPDNVLVTPGAQAALFAAHMLACPPGAAALYVDPCYTTYPGTIRAASARAVPVATRPEAGFLPDADALEAAAAQTGARSLLVNTPNNPTGAVYPRATLMGIARVARACDLWLISDEVYEGQVWQGTHLSPRALPGMSERTLVIGSMSKGHAMTGARLGWIVGPEAAVAHLIDLATVTTYGVPGFIQDAALFALREGPAHEAQVAAPFARRRRIAEAVLRDAPGLRLLPAEGAMYLMLDIRATGLSGAAFAQGLLETQRIAVMPGESFGRAAAGHVRVAMTVPDAAFEDALRRLASFAADRSTRAARA
ncbi:arginine:pyruvate transaminase [Roseivivax lentus]|uniref:Aminotransferase n=1 Tax=Roseivivax lentus TaxID=633194 RepID=A0A1N7N155_9RHOB|nr:aminotransferase class I/II-fold pyridoxal phosphate-dependent enzyme [Roseivivax lentus]SIS92090.1 arginine:pyruvate transaminase [Roseivivax lentus]